MIQKKKTLKHKSIYIHKAIPRIPETMYTFTVIGPHKKVYIFSGYQSIPIQFQSLPQFHHRPKFRFSHGNSNIHQ